MKTDTPSMQSVIEMANAAHKEGVVSGILIAKESAETVAKEKPGLRQAFEAFADVLDRTAKRIKDET